MAKQKQKGFFNKMREVFGNWHKGRSLHQRERHTELEAEYRRHQTWRSLGDFTRGLWNEANVGRRVEAVLRKRSRTEKADRVQQAKEKIHERNIRLAKLCDTKGYQDYIKFQQKCERIAYMGLRHPEFRTDKHSLEYYIGFYNGILSNIEDTRKFFDDAKVGIAKEEMEAEEDQE